NVACQALDVVNALGDLHTPTLAATTGVDLRFHDPHGATQLLRSLDGFLNGKCRNAAGDGHTKLAQDLLGLVFVNLHEGSLREGISPVCHGWHVWRRAVDMAARNCIMLQRTKTC